MGMEKAGFYFLKPSFRGQKAEGCPTGFEGCPPTLKDRAQKGHAVPFVPARLQGLNDLFGFQGSPDPTPLFKKAGDFIFCRN
jgi:hypothetical protein